MSVRHYRLGQTFTLNLLANDNFQRGYPGAGVVTGVELVSGEAEFDFLPNGLVTVTPTKAGAVHLRYTVDGEYTGDHYLTVSPQTAGDRVVVDMNSDAADVEVLANDFRPLQPLVHRRAAARDRRRRDPERRRRLDRARRQVGPLHAAGRLLRQGHVHLHGRRLLDPRRSAST